MTTNNNWLVHEHSLYEDLLAACQTAAGGEDWAGVDRIIHELVTHLKRHVALEEEVLFPAYESRPEAPQGPTDALRADHDSIVRLLRDTIYLIRAEDSDAVLESLQRLENYMIRHHEKEEDIFLPMASYLLNSSRDEILQRMAAFDPAQSRRHWEF